jgi:tetratricopeptide (TPR) repeat protein
VKVEQALRLLPDVDLASPLHSVLIASARPEGNDWSGSSEYATLGKRDVSASDVRAAMAQSLESANRHYGDLYERLATAMELLEKNDGPGAVTKFLENGESEQGFGRLEQADGWYHVARTVAEELDERQPEVDALIASGQLAVMAGYYEKAARAFQRGLALADAEEDRGASAQAAKGLGDVALRQASWNGAQVWFTRALKLAEMMADRDLTAEIHHSKGELARRMDDLPAARDELVIARDSFETLGEARNMARVLTTMGLVETQAGDQPKATAAFLEALAWARRAPTTNQSLQAFIRLQIAKLYLGQQRYLEADEELRRVERIALDARHWSRLAHVYSLLGSSKGRQGDENGFIFFEEALKLARMLPQWPIVEARVRRDYAAFKQQLGSPVEARAHLERALEIFTQVGATADANGVKAELAWNATADS